MHASQQTIKKRQEADTLLSTKSQTFSASTTDMIKQHAADLDEARLSALCSLLFYCVLAPLTASFFAQVQRSFNGLLTVTALMAIIL